jgi:hypothetical protein
MFVSRFEQFFPLTRRHRDETSRPTPFFEQLFYRYFQGNLVQYFRSPLRPLRSFAPIRAHSCFLGMGAMRIGGAPRAHSL